MQKVRIGDIATFTNGLAFKPEDWSSSGKKIIRIQNLTDSTKTYNRTSKEVADKYIVKKGDVLVSWSATIDVFLWADEDAVLNQHIFKVDFDNSRVFKQYFTQALKVSIQELTKLAHGSTMKHVIKSDFEDHLIPLPEYPNQIRIANLLATVENLINEGKKSAELFNELVEAAFDKEFGDPIINEKNWEVCQLGQVCHVTKLAGFEYTKYIKYDDTGEIALVRGLNVKNGKIKLENLKFIDKNISDSLQRSKLFRNDVVFTYIGVNIGDVAIIEENDRFHLAPNVAKITPKDLRELNPYYLLYYLMFNRSLFSKHTTNTAKQALNMSNIRDIDIIIPPLNLQNKFASQVKEIENAKRDQEIQVEGFKELYFSVSNKVFNEAFEFSRIPFDEGLLPVMESSHTQPNQITQEYIEQPNMPSVPISSKNLFDKKAGNLTWEQISFERVANYIRSHFNQHYFNNYMLLRYLTDDLGIDVRYYSSADKKKNPALEDTDDLHSFITGAITGKHSFLKLEQKFYNAEEDNIDDISFTDDDLERLQMIDQKKRSGVYFKIKSEVTEG
jgi:type I restriction enzyme S subunit